MGYCPVVQKLCGSFKGDAFDKRVLPFFMYAICDALAKRHSGNGMVECGQADTLRLLSRPQQALDLHYLKSIIKEKL